MISTILLTITSVSAQSAANAAVSDWIAMTRDGVQIEVSEKPSKGALEVNTPFGLFRTPLDPVELVFERQRDRSWLMGLRTGNNATLLEAIAVFHDNGQIRALIEVGEVAVQRGWPEEVRAALRGLEDWGARLDPVPADLSGEERVEWLWKKIQKRQGLAKLLLSGRLATELTPGGNGFGGRQLGLSDLRKSMKSSDPILQRAGAQFAGVQLMDDPYLLSRLQNMSLYAPVASRDRVAQSAVELDFAATREYWVKALLRADDPVRMIAARHLAYELPLYAPKVFALVLSSIGHKAPQRYTFVDHDIQVVVDRRQPTPLFPSGRAYFGPKPLAGEYLESASVIKMVKVPDLLGNQIQRYLLRLAGDDKERTVEEWLLWYKKQQIRS
jgi:hypothetical protein